MQAPGIFTGSEVRIREPDLPTIHFAVAFQGASASDPDAIALTVLQTMIGSWEKSAGAGTAPVRLGFGVWFGFRVYTYGNHNVLVTSPPIPRLSAFAFFFLSP